MQVSPFIHNIPIEGTELYILNQIEKYIQFTKTYHNLFDNNSDTYKMIVSIEQNQSTIQIFDEYDTILLNYEYPTNIDEKNFIKHIRYAIRLLKFAGNKNISKELEVKIYYKGTVRSIFFDYFKYDDNKCFINIINKTLSIIYGIK